MWYSDKNNRTPGLIGLPNLGNTCYMNAALQSLLNCPALNNYFLNCLPLIRTYKKIDLSYGFYCLISGIWDNEKILPYVTSQNIIRIMRQHFLQFRGYSQCDAQEFLRCFMDLLHNELKDKVFVTKKNNFSVDTDYLILQNEPNLSIIKQIRQIYEEDSSASSNSDSSSTMGYETCDSGHVSECVATEIKHKLQTFYFSTTESNIDSNSCLSNDTGINSLEQGNGYQKPQDLNVKEEQPNSSNEINNTIKISKKRFSNNLGALSNRTMSKGGKLKYRNGKKKQNNSIKLAFKKSNTKNIIENEDSNNTEIIPLVNLDSSNFITNNHTIQNDLLKSSKSLDDINKSIGVLNIGNELTPQKLRSHSKSPVAPIIQIEAQCNSLTPTISTSRELLQSPFTSPNIDLVNRTQMTSQQNHYHHHYYQKHHKTKKGFYHRSIISDIFDGKIVSTVECLTCHTISKTIEVFQDLSLFIPTPAQVTNLNSNMNSNIFCNSLADKNIDPSNKNSSTLQPPSVAHRFTSAYQFDKKFSDDMPSESSNNQKRLSFLSQQDKFCNSYVPNSLANKEFNNNNNINTNTNLNPIISLMSKLTALVKLETISNKLTALSPTSMTNIATWLYELFKRIIPLGSTITLQNCLSAFFACDELNGDNMYSCESCKKLRNGLKESKLTKLPEILCIHLKRFRHDYACSSKVSTKIEFPLEDLDMSPYLDKSCVDEVRTYNLISVIAHHGGSIAAGHYTAYALNYFDGHWYEYDDETVTRMKEFQIEKIEPYVLFYGKSQDAIALKRVEAQRLQQEYNNEISKNNLEINDNSDGTAHSCHLPFYISKQWLNRFNYTAEPGPIDHSDFVCVHRAIKPSRYEIIDDICQDIGLNTWLYLFKNFGGDGPINILQSCKICEEEERNLVEKRREELLFYSEHMKMQYTEDRDKNTFIINLKWFKEWEDFVKGQESEPPGLIDNKAILKTSNKDQVTNKKNIPICYIGEGLWKYLVERYGGGPEIPAQSFL